MFEGQKYLYFGDCALAISARRIWEHIQLRQINPFPAVTPTRALQPQTYVDVIDVSSPVDTLTEYTLSEVMAGQYSNLQQIHVNELLTNIKQKTVRLWLARLKQHLLEFSDQRAVRNPPQPFLPMDGNSPLGVQGLHSALATWLKAHSAEKASPEQWLARIQNLSKKGLRAEEFETSHLAKNLENMPGTAMTGDAVLDCLNFETLRICILPMIRTTDGHITFSKIPANAKIKRIKPKLRDGITSKPQWRDRLLGYWIDTISWDDLLGPMNKWMAFTHRGKPIVSPDKPSGLCDTQDDAWSLANIHAEKEFPKLTAVGKWSEYRLTGGEQYREWLVTLPYYPPSFYSSHFPHRNVLLHVRCDIREDANGNRVLVLHEVQSDWAQQVRRDLKEDDLSDKLPVPPWFQEWPAFALKLMLIHAVQNAASALAWTHGDVQVERYKGLGKAGLLELYDRTLPAEAARILRLYGKKCEGIEVFLPVNFYIEPADIGYNVLNDDQSLLGTATTWEGVQKLLPNGAHETLKQMHGIQIDEALREALLRDGFYAWGIGIK